VEYAAEEERVSAQVEVPRALCFDGDSPSE